MDGDELDSHLLKPAHVQSIFLKQTFAYKTRIDLKKASVLRDFNKLGSVQRTLVLQEVHEDRTLLRAVLLIPEILVHYANPPYLENTR